MIISEFLANPAGKDADGEYILLFNDSKVGVSLAGWKVQDASGKVFKLSGSVESGAEMKLTATQTKINLNNTGETISLFDASGKLVDSLGYTGTAVEDMPVLRAGKELSAEIKDKLFDDLPGKFFPPATSAVSGESLWLIMVSAGILFALVAVYVVKNITDDKYKID